MIAIGRVAQGAGLDGKQPGHRRRRAESLPLLFGKLRSNLSASLPKQRVEGLLELFQDRRRLEGLMVPELMERFL